MSDSTSGPEFLAALGDIVTFDELREIANNDLVASWLKLCDEQWGDPIVAEDDYRERACDLRQRAAAEEASGQG